MGRYIYEDDFSKEKTKVTGFALTVFIKLLSMTLLIVTKNNSVCKVTQNRTYYDT